MLLGFQEIFPDQVLSLGNEAALFQCTRLHRHPGGWHLNINPNKFIFRENGGKIITALGLVQAAKSSRRFVFVLEQNISATSDIVMYCFSLFLITFPLISKKDFSG